MEVFKAALKEAKETYETWQAGMNCWYCNLKHSAAYCQVEARVWKALEEKLKMNRADILKYIARDKKD